MGDRNHTTEILNADYLARINLIPSASQVETQIALGSSLYNLNLSGDVRAGLRSIQAALGEDVELDISISIARDLLLLSPNYLRAFGSLMTALECLKLARLTVRTRSAAVYLLAPVIKKFGSRARIVVPIETFNRRLSEKLLPISEAAPEKRTLLLSRLVQAGIPAEVELSPIFRGFGEVVDYSEILRSLNCPITLRSPEEVIPELQKLTPSLRDNEVVQRIILSSSRQYGRFCELFQQALRSANERSSNNPDVFKTA